MWRCLRIHMVVYFVILIFLLLWLHSDEIQRLPINIYTAKDVFVAVCEEHQDVIPYWMKVFRKYKNTDPFVLIHLDAHSDMAAPKYSNFFLSYDDTEPEYYMPMMHHNDAFIISAVLIGSIDHVVWIKPNWLSDQNSYQWNGTVGLHKESNKFCICYESSVKNISCITFNRDEMIVHNVKQTTCNRIRMFLFTVVTVEYLKRNRNRLLKTFQKRNFILDIDEDFFGVENRITKLIDCGIPFQSIDYINFLISNKFCPQSLSSENELNDYLLKLLETLTPVEIDNTRLFPRNHASNDLTTNKCISKIDNRLDKSSLENIFIDLDSNTSKCLSHTKFCFSSGFLQNTSKQSKFMICHGNILPNHYLTEYHLPNNQEIKNVLRNLQELMRDLFAEYQIELVTIARSIRDGYTPVQHWTNIENGLIQILQKSSFKTNFVMKYNDKLLFGPQGWK